MITVYDGECETRILVDTKQFCNLSRMKISILFSGQGMAFIIYDHILNMKYVSVNDLPQRILCEISCLLRRHTYIIFHIVKRLIGKLTMKIFLRCFMALKNVPFITEMKSSIRYFQIYNSLPLVISQKSSAQKVRRFCTCYAVDCFLSKLTKYRLTNCLVVRTWITID